jgi:hypothetical protein
VRGEFSAPELRLLQKAHELREVVWDAEYKKLQIILLIILFQGYTGMSSGKVRNSEYNTETKRQFSAMYIIDQ